MSACHAPDSTVKQQRCVALCLLTRVRQLHRKTSDFHAYNICTEMIFHSRSEHEHVVAFLWTSEAMLWCCLCLPGSQISQIGWFLKWSLAWLGFPFLSTKFQSGERREYMLDRPPPLRADVPVLPVSYVLRTIQGWCKTPVWSGIIWMRGLKHTFQPHTLHDPHSQRVSTLCHLIIRYKSCWYVSALIKHQWRQQHLHWSWQQSAKHQQVSCLVLCYVIAQWEEGGSGKKEKAGGDVS